MGAWRWVCRRGSVIREAVEMNIEFMEDVTKREEVGDEEEGPQDGALGHTCSDWSGF